MKHIIFMVVLFVAMAAQAEETTLPHASLFFTADEAHQAESLAAKSAPVGHGDICLGAVMYFGPEDWTVWLQGERWTPDTLRDDMQIIEVSADEVRLAWRGADQSQKQEIVLRPNQSYQIATGKIIASP